jgi:ribosome-associated toxin RatA of RatAB toxin-antitoxin module
MRHVIMHVHAAGITPDAAYARISDFTRYPELTETVLEVDLRPAGDDGAAVSTWTVRFRRGRLRWTERDVFDPAARRIDYDQISGDFAVMEGSWRVDPAPDHDGVVVRFEARFDLGMPTLAEILDPIAESTLRGNILLILTGLLGPVAEIPPVAAARPPA